MVFDRADTAYMLLCAALVLFMTPGLAFFYGGLVRSKNVVNTMMMSFIAMGLVAVQWVLFGYSFSFGPGNGLIGSIVGSWEWADGSVNLELWTSRGGPSSISTPGYRHSSHRSCWGGGPAFRTG